MTSQDSSSTYSSAVLPTSTQAVASTSFLQPTTTEPTGKQKVTLYTHVTTQKAFICNHHCQCVPFPNGFGQKCPLAWKNPNCFTYVMFACDGALIIEYLTLDRYRVGSFPCSDLTRLLLDLQQRCASNVRTRHISVIRFSTNHTWTNRWIFCVLSPMPLASYVRNAILVWKSLDRFK